jgi:hypothetical protein
MTARRNRRALASLPRVAAVLVLATTEAHACSICFSGMVITAGQKLDSADQVALAVPIPRRWKL